mmetsp:Transcript_42489/g.51565  ORF Transcript_42489/g.51565 Transcript_42489/m.51565 type:complete len:306 (-) Transcript_42489:435-1352(-)|eukprot:CAMPEP_0197849138 /NCGR_PEP_ID=MMETSP1438-20131217/11017_1 /TAXON_ID=1461541 /ORGANISM="Pterosperma sp., Strain CCMP1384" /LENGTH=305 /DNA_ID=CAMNT_0043461677 /DNA_START=220 /DNA_END=1137 /DNA_ORIENTATION=-
MVAPDWKGLLKWSLSESDGTRPAKEVSEADKKWFAEAMSSFVDEVEVMRQINAYLRREPEEGVTEEEMVEVKEGILEELQDIVESIDRARDLKQIGGFPVLMELLASKHEGLRWRSAEVLATCVQNNPPVQDWALEQGALPRILHLCKDSSQTCQAKALLALSCISRGNTPALNALRLGGGIKLTCDMANMNNVRISRKALIFLRHLLQIFPSDVKLLWCNELLGKSVDVLKGAEGENDQVEAALGLMMAMLTDVDVRKKCQAVPGLLGILEARQDHISKLNAEDRAATREEAQILTSIIQSLKN